MMMLYLLEYTELRFVKEDFNADDTQWYFVSL